MKCQVPRCRQPMVLTYIRWDICYKHWEGHCNDKYHLLVKLGKVPDDFDKRVQNIQKLLDKGSRKLVMKWGPTFSGNLPLSVFRPYLKDKRNRGAKYSAPERLPPTWEELDVITDVIKEGAPHQKKEDE